MLRLLLALMHYPWELQYGMFYHPHYYHNVPMLLRPLSWPWLVLKYKLYISSLFNLVNFILSSHKKKSTKNLQNISTISIKFSPPSSLFLSKLLPFCQCNFPSLFPPRHFIPSIQLSLLPCRPSIHILQVPYQPHCPDTNGFETGWVHTELHYYHFTT